MKIKNKLVKINNGKKIIELQNTILDQYLEKIVDNQFETNSNNRNSLAMTYAYLRFDNDLSFDHTSNLVESDFNLRVQFFNNSINISQQQINLDYFYCFNNSQRKYNIAIYNIQTGTNINDLTPYIGKQIKAIGFGGTTTGNNTIYACVDTSLYELYILSIDGISITREDVITIDTLFHATNNIVDGAVHLFNGQDEYLAGSQFPANQLIGILHSVGISTMQINMDIEQTLIPYSSHVEIDGNTIDILDEFPIEYEAEGLYPADDLYPATDVFPERTIDKAMYPSDDIYPGIDIYPVSAPYQYMQLKYKVYRQKISDGTITDTGEYYILSKPIGTKEKVKMNIEYIGA